MSTNRLIQQMAIALKARLDTLTRRLQAQDFQIELQRGRIAQLEARLVDVEPAPGKDAAARHHSAPPRIKHVS